jgi:hypothetical protein
MSLERVTATPTTLRTADFFREPVPGECDPNSPHAVFGLLRITGYFGVVREIVARFHDRARANAACAQRNADANSDAELYEVIGWG